MRALIALFFTILISLNPALGKSRCTELSTPKGKELRPTATGYTPVVVQIDFPTTDEYEKLVSAKIFYYRFWFAGTYSDIRHDARGNMKAVHLCTFQPVDTNKTYLRVRGEVPPTGRVDEAHRFMTGLLLPSALVRARPAAGTEFADGTSFTGSWSSGAAPDGRKFEQLTFKLAE